MGLTSALLTGLSGLDVNQTALNVIGNNIANANTPGFKSSSVVFSPQYYVTSSGASAPTSDFGGTDPSQLGLGAQVAAIEKNFSAGSLEDTGVDTDMAVNGDGFFVVQSGGGQSYTRDGSFELNSQNQLVTTGGQFVQGYGVDSSYNIVPGQLQNIVIPLGAASTAEATQNVNLSGNFDSGGAVASGASILNSESLTTVGGAAAPTGATLLTSVAATSSDATPLFTVGQTFTLAGEVGSQDMTPQTFTVGAGSTLSDLEGFLQNGMQINATAPAGPNGLTPGGSLVADPKNANGVFLTLTGNTGSDNALSLPTGSFVDAAGDSPLTFAAGVDSHGNTSNPVGESINTTAVVYDSLGNPLNVNINMVYESSNTSGTTWSYTATSPSNVSATGNQIVGTGTLTYGNNGQLLTAVGTTLNIDRTGTGATSPLSVKLNFGSTTALAATSSNFAVSSQDGSPLGSLSSFSIGSDGTITGSFTNGLTRTLGQVAVATFNNPQGLNDQGSNLYASTANSGAPIITTPMNLGAGSIKSGSLELSNVDLSTEFTNLIIASTGFSASSKVITTSDQLITDLLNTNR
jgi:flagellar hook protein FlgE